MRPFACTHCCTVIGQHDGTRLQVRIVTDQGERTLTVTRTWTSICTCGWFNTWRPQARPVLLVPL